MALIEHYQRWHIIYGAVGFVLMILAVCDTPLNEWIRKFILFMWRRISPVCGWITAIIIGLMVAGCLLMAAHAVYTLVARKYKKRKVGYDDEWN